MQSALTVLCWLMNETYRTILGLRAIREFQDRPLEQEDLDLVLDAARWTGSGKNLVQEPGAYELDTGRMAQNIMLAADSLGMATCPITLHRDGDAARVLGLPPGWRCRYAIALGYPDPTARPKNFGGRKPIEEITHHDSFGW